MTEEVVMMLGGLLVVDGVGEVGANQSFAEPLLLDQTQIILKNLLKDSS